MKDGKGSEELEALGEEREAKSRVTGKAGGWRMHPGLRDGWRGEAGGTVIGGKKRCGPMCLAT